MCAAPRRRTSRLCPQVTDAALAEHLSHWGINMLGMQKTEKSMAEMNVDARHVTRALLPLPAACCTCLLLAVLLGAATHRSGMP